MADAPPPFYRHKLPVRLWHWTNALSVIVMLMSGLMILNAIRGSTGVRMGRMPTMRGSRSRWGISALAR